MRDLLDNMILAHSRNPHWDGVGIGYVMVEAMLMSEDHHQEDDQASLRTNSSVNLDRETALKWVTEAGSLRAAQERYGISKSTLHRALQVQRPKQVPIYG